MKYRETTFVLAVASALFTTTAGASMYGECEQMRKWGEAHISDWFEQEKRDGQNDILFEARKACVERLSISQLKPATDEQITECELEAKLATLQYRPPEEIPNLTVLVEKIKDLSIVYSAFCKD